VTWFSGILVYIVIWFLVLFAVLPWGVKAPKTVEPGHEGGAPANPRLWLKAAITSGVAILIWLVVFYVIENDLIPIRGE
jgi:predicted secreted protein